MVVRETEIRQCSRDRGTALPACEDRERMREYLKAWSFLTRLGSFATGEGARFAGVPASSGGEREKGVLGRIEKETWKGREREEFEIFLEMVECFHGGFEIV